LFFLQKEEPQGIGFSLFAYDFPNPDEEVHILGGSSMNRRMRRNLRRLNTTIEYYQNYVDIIRICEKLGVRSVFDLGTGIYGPQADLFLEKHIRYYGVERNISEGHFMRGYLDAEDAPITLREGSFPEVKPDPADVCVCLYSLGTDGNTKQVVRWLGQLSKQYQYVFFATFPEVMEAVQHKIRHVKSIQIGMDETVLVLSSNIQSYRNLEKVVGKSAAA